MGWEGADPAALTSQKRCPFYKLHHGGFPLPWSLCVILCCLGNTWDTSLFPSATSPRRMPASHTTREAPFLGHDTHL